MPILTSRCTAVQAVQSGRTERRTLMPPGNWGQPAPASATLHAAAI